MRLVGACQPLLENLVVRKALSDLFEGDTSLLTGQGLPDAKVGSVAEVDLPLRLAANIDAIRIVELTGIATGRTGHQRDSGTFGNRHTVKGDIALSHPSLEVGRRVVTEDLLDRLRNERRVFPHPPALIGVLPQVDEATSDQLDGRLRARGGEQAREGDHLPIRQNAAHPIHILELRLGRNGNQILARILAPARGQSELSAHELGALLDLSQQRGVIDREEEQMLQQVLSLGQMKVQDLMTPRVDIVAFDFDDDPAELMEIVRTGPLGRVVVYEGDLDHVMGVVYRRQVLLRRPSSRDEVRSLIRQVRYVPQIQRADALLVDLRRRGTTIAIVVDEYGGTEGLVTLEDVVEHMVGRIGESDHERPASQVVRLDERTWRVSADLSIREWAGVFGPVAPGQAVSTIGGMVMASLGRAAAIGDRTRLGNVEIEVETMDGRRIESLLIRLDQTGQGETETA